MKVLYFTATGNNLYIGKRIGGELISIPKSIKEGNYEFTDEVIGIVFPIYGLTVPSYIAEFLKKVKLNSNYIFAIMSYGKSDGAAVSKLLEIGEQCHIKFSYVNIIKMVDNYLPGYHMEKQIASEHKKNIEEHIDKIIEDIKNRKHLMPKNSFIDKFVTETFAKVLNFNTGVGVTKNYRVEDKCTSCGICAKVCPTNNITVNNHKPLFGKECISCLACTQNCPENAIRHKWERSKARFRNQHISLKEIIEANE